MADPPPATRSVSPAARLRRLRREEALERVGLTRLAQAYLADQPVPLGGGDSWRWDRDGIPGWLVPQFRDLGFLP